MAKDFLDEREFELVNIVGGQLSANQRDLSRQMNLSLGMTNILLRRLVSKGYIRIKQLNQRKMQYLLTTKGFSEKMRKSVKYTLKTINSIALIKSRLNEIILNLYRQGHREFYVIATSDFELLLKMILEERKSDHMQFHFLHEGHDHINKGILLICKEYVNVASTEALQVVNVVHELSKDNLLSARP